MDVREGGPLVYRCTQGVLFVKRSEDPADRQILKVARPVGAYVYSTGWIWEGPNGGTWAEFDASKGEMGWALVQGPGFGLRGPALLDMKDQALRDTVSVAVQNIGNTSQSSRVVFEALMDRDSDIGFVKRLLCDKTGLSLQFCCLSQDERRSLADDAGREFALPASFLRPLDDGARLRSLAPGDHLQLRLVYTGGLDDGVLHSNINVNVEYDRDSDYSDDLEDSELADKRGAAVQQPKYGGYHLSSPEADEFENRTDFEGHNMEPILIAPKPTIVHHLSPRSTSLMQAGWRRGMEVEPDLGRLAGSGWLENPPPRGSAFYGTAADRPYTVYPNPRDVADDFDDDEVQFGPAVHPVQLPDFGYGQEIEWIDAD